jgi:hypothetical protein
MDTRVRFPRSPVCSTLYTLPHDPMSDRSASVSFEADCRGKWPFGQGGKPLSGHKSSLCEEAIIGAGVGTQ